MEACNGYLARCVPLAMAILMHVWSTDTVYMYKRVWNWNPGGKSPLTNSRLETMLH